MSQQLEPRGKMTAILSRSSETPDHIRWYKNKDAKVAKTDIPRYHKAGEIDPRRHSYLLDQGRRANQPDHDFIENIEEAVTDGKINSVEAPHWWVTTKARMIHEADILVGYSVMSQDPSFDINSATKQDLQPDSNIVVWISEGLIQEIWLSLETL